MLGFVSFFMDASSELIHALLPIFLVGTLGASTGLVGLIEGIGEATASITKLFSGWISDWLGKRKLLAVLGYGMAAITKPIFPLAVTPYEVLAARFLDRVGKGIRGAPRDALIADVTPAGIRGAAFGLRQALDTVGAFVGPLLAIGLMALLASNIRLVFWWAIVPAALCVLLLVLGVEEPANVPHDAKPPIGWGELNRLDGAFWGVVAVGIVFTLARFSEAFLVLRASDVGLKPEMVPIVMVAMNAVYALVSAPAGSLSDRIGRRTVLMAGLLALIAADLVLGLWGSIAGAIVGAGIWGLSNGLTQGLLSALVADAAPASLRGTAFGIFNLLTGIALLAASGLAGLLWQEHGPTATFLAGAGFAALSLIGLTLAVRRRA
jgi:MFS family permease